MLTRDRLWGLLGWPEGPPTPPAPPQWHGVVQRDGYWWQSFTLAGTEVSGLFVSPNGPGPHPALLYCHAHGNRYAQGSGELLQGRPSLQSPYGPVLAANGIASLSIDLPPFGARQSEGPESALAKAAHWRGQTLMGQMLIELCWALEALSTRDGIDEDRIATLGLSMGGSHAYWLAALEPQIVGTAHLCVFSDIAPLLETGDHDLHAPYLTVPGLLAGADMSDVAALVAPRPQFVALGALDPLTPGLPNSSGLTKLRSAYHSTPDALEVLIETESGHIETAAMRDGVLSFLNRLFELA